MFQFIWLVLSGWEESYTETADSFALILHMFTFDWQSIEVFSCFMSSQHKGKKTSYYPVYHSLHDTYHWVKTFMDPKFACHRAVGEFTGRLLLQYADSIVIPFDPRTYTQALQKGVDDFKKLLATTNATANNVNTGKSQTPI